MRLSNQTKDNVTVSVDAGELICDGGEAAALPRLPPRLSRRRIDSMKWAGCNYWINQGKHPKEPIGTATSMHDCKACEHDGSCPFQKEDEVWPHNEDHDKRVTEVTNEWKCQERALREPKKPAGPPAKFKVGQVVHIDRLNEDGKIVRARGFDPFGGEHSYDIVLGGTDQEVSWTEKHLSRVSGRLRR